MNIAPDRQIDKQTDVFFVPLCLRWSLTVYGDTAPGDKPRRDITCPGCAYLKDSLLFT